MNECIYVCEGEREGDRKRKEREKERGRGGRGGERETQREREGAGDQTMPNLLLWFLPGLLLFVPGKLVYSLVLGSLFSFSLGPLSTSLVLWGNCFLCNHLISVL